VHVNNITGFVYWAKDYALLNSYLRAHLIKKINLLILDKDQYYHQIESAVTYLSDRVSTSPKIAIVLGSGLSNLTNHIDSSVVIPYADIPHFPQATVKGHKSNLIFGTLNGVEVMAMQGRFHYYEGYSMKEVTFPMRVMQLMGIETILLSNAAGGVHEDYYAGDVVFVTDHISLHQENPLRGENDERLGPRFPDMFDTYDTDLLEKAKNISKRNGYKVLTGIYFGWPGPNLETPAEYNMINTLGGDLVGMSTVPEVLVAQHAGMRIFVASVVTNECFPIGRLNTTTHDEVVDVAQIAEPKLTKIISELVTEI